MLGKWFKRGILVRVGSIFFLPHCTVEIYTLLILILHYEMMKVSRQCQSLSASSIFVKILEISPSKIMVGQLKYLWCQNVASFWGLIRYFASWQPCLFIFMCNSLLTLFWINFLQQKGSRSRTILLNYHNFQCSRTIYTILCVYGC